MKGILSPFGGLRGRLMLLFGSVVLMASLILALISINQASQALEAEASEAMLLVAQQVAETVNLQIQSRMAALEGTAGRDVIRGGRGDRESTQRKNLRCWKKNTSGLRKWGIWK